MILSLCPVVCRSADVTEPVSCIHRCVCVCCVFCLCCDAQMSHWWLKTDCFCRSWFCYLLCRCDVDRVMFGRQTVRRIHLVVQREVCELGHIVWWTAEHDHPVDLVCNRVWLPKFEQIWIMLIFVQLFERVIFFDTPGSGKGQESRRKDPRQAKKWTI